MPEMGTKAALGASIKAMMQKTPFQRITVGDICAHCGISRKSFYYHFKDKYDLLNWVFYTEYMVFIGEKEFDSFWSFLSATAEFLFQDRLFYRNAMMITGQNGFVEFFGETLEPIALTFLGEGKPNEPFYQFFSTFAADAFRCALLRWLHDENPYPPEEFTALCQRALEGPMSSMIK